LKNCRKRTRSCGRGWESRIRKFGKIYNVKVYIGPADKILLVFGLAI